MKALQQVSNAIALDLLASPHAMQVREDYSPEGRELIQRSALPCGTLRVLRACPFSMVTFLHMGHSQGKYPNIG